MPHSKLLQNIKCIPSLVHEQSLLGLVELNVKEVCHEANVGHIKLIRKLTLELRYALFIVTRNQQSCLCMDKGLSPFICILLHIHTIFGYTFLEVSLL